MILRRADISQPEVFHIGFSRHTRAVAFLFHVFKSSQGCWKEGSLKRIGALTSGFASQAKNKVETWLRTRLDGTCLFARQSFKTSVRCSFLALHKGLGARAQDYVPRLREGIADGAGSAGSFKNI